LNGEIDLTATCDSGLSVSYSSDNANVVQVSGNKLIIKGVGTATITASQAGNDNYNPAIAVSRNQVITKATQTIAFGVLSSQPYSLNGEIDLTATCDSGLSVSYSSDNSNVVQVSGNKLIVKGVGTATITASQAGNDNYNPAIAVSRNQVITKANQTIAFGVLSSQPYSLNGEIDLTATCDSGLSVSYSSDNSNVVQVSGNKLIMKGVGTATITASQAGNDNYNPAIAVSRTISIITTSITTNNIPDRLLTTIVFNFNP
jgi:mRNA-degrading endonuclease HigB of HigAB toxin-antitoxin module